MYSWAPVEKQCQITGFKWDYSHPGVRNLMLLGTIDFTNIAVIFDAVLYSIDNTRELYNNIHNFVTDPDEQLLWIIW